MAISSSLKSALKSSELVVRQYVAQLEAENAKLQKEIAKLEVKNIRQKHKIAALQKELNKGPTQHIKVSWGDTPQSVESLSDAELENIVRNGSRP